MARRESYPARNVLALAALILCSCLPGMAQSLMTVRRAVHQDVSAPLRDLIRQAPPAPSGEHEAEPARRIPLPQGLAALAEDPVRQQTVTPGTPAVGSSFEGLGQGQYGFTVQYAPPDTNGTVGATQYVQWVNVNFAIFDKTTGALVAGPTAGNTLWAGFGGGCQNNNNGDPIVLYDKAAQRWVFSQFSVKTTPYLQCIAVSTTSDATGTYNRYSFQYNNFDDYPKMGVWADAYYETFNMFNGNTFVGADACAYNRAAMLTGAAATQVCFQQPSTVGGLLPADIDGSAAPPTGSPNYMVYFGTNNLNLYKFHVDFTTPSNSTFIGPTVISVASFTPLCGGGTCVPQPGTTNKLDSLADRLMYRLAYRNFGTHESLVVNHSVAVSGGGGGVRWYEIQNPSGTPAVAQQGTFAPDASYRWMGSIAMDQAGDMALGYSVSNSSSIYPSVAYTGRVPTDPAGTMEAEVNVVSGTGSQTSGLSRWGDYSAMQVDPVDDCTFWYTQEYMKTTGNYWNTRIANFKFPGCGSTGASPVVSLSTTTLKFAKTPIGQASKPKKVTLTNTGNATLNIISISNTGDFVIQSNTCGSQVLAGNSCAVTLAFTPTAMGLRTGVLSFYDNAAGSPQTVSLSGVGMSLALSPTALKFGKITVGQTSSPQSVTVTNVSNATVTLTSISLGGTYAADFIIASNTCGASLAAGNSCSVGVEFKPAVTGSLNAKLNVYNNGGGSPAQTSLSGTGQ